MTREKMLPILQKIQEYDHIILFRHKRPDGDCLGASKGLQRMLRLSFPEKQVDLPESDGSEHLTFLGPDDPAMSEAAYVNALGVVVDTGSSDRISNPHFSLCRELVKIDHHPNVEPYAPTLWVEEDCSSCCEMIAALAETFPETLKIDPQAASFLYLGMVTDSGRFRFPGVNGDTLRRAAFLMDAGVDTQRLYARLYLRDFESFRFEAWVYDQLHRTENGVVWLRIDREDQEKFGLSFENASAAVGYLDTIKGCICQLAFIDAPDGSIRVRLRSRFMSVNGLAERYHGGGHACASGATVYSVEELNALVAEADALTGQYKAGHNDWL